MSSSSSSFVRLLISTGIDHDNAERLAEHLEIYNENQSSTGSDAHAFLRITDDGPSLMIGGVEITSGEFECVARIEQINRENGYTLGGLAL